MRHILQVKDSSRTQLVGEVRWIEALGGDSTAVRCLGPRRKKLSWSSGYVHRAIGLAVLHFSIVPERRE